MSRHLGFQDASLINTMSSPFPQLHNLKDLYTTPLSDYHELFGALIRPKSSIMYFLTFEFCVSYREHGDTEFLLIICVEFYCIF
jgi:hypothetical protein